MAEESPSLEKQSDALFCRSRQQLLPQIEHRRQSHAGAFVHVFDRRLPWLLDDVAEKIRIPFDVSRKEMPIRQNPQLERVAGHFIACDSIPVESLLAGCRIGRDLNTLDQLGMSIRRQSSFVQRSDRQLIRGKRGQRYSDNG